MTPQRVLVHHCEGAPDKTRRSDEPDRADEAVAWTGARPAGAMAAIQSNTPFKRTYEHLLHEGKAPMSALGAIMRKLLIVARGVLVHEEDYNPDRVSTPAESE